MPSLAEQLAAASAKLDSLIPVAKSEPEQVVELSAAEALTSVSAELAKAELSDERRKYLGEVLAEVAKVNSEGTNTSIKIKVLNDPDQIKPSTATIATIQTLTTGKPDSLFASNLKQVIGKAELIQKLLNDREKLAKGKVSDKLEDIKKLFGLSEEDMSSECELRWTVSDLVSQLQSAVKLERMIEKAASEAQTTEKSAAAEDDKGWPKDMAGAKFDPLKKAYDLPQPKWGFDDHASRR